MYKCKICNNEFKLKKEERYIVIDNVETGLAVLGKHTQENIYDAFDCPVCGCQNVVNTRKRMYLEKVLCVDEEDEEEDEELEIEHDGCCGCLYTDKSEKEEPCISCKCTKMSGTKEHMEAKDMYKPRW